MNERDFKDAFIAAFLGALAAEQYEERCVMGRWPMTWPIEDAETLADDAWAKLKG
jgi:hypothetical protein